HPTTHDHRGRPISTGNPAPTAGRPRRAARPAGRSLGPVATAGRPPRGGGGRDAPARASTVVPARPPARRVSPRRRPGPADARTRERADAVASGQHRRDRLAPVTVDQSAASALRTRSRGEPEGAAADVAVPGFPRTRPGR